MSAAGWTIFCSSEVGLAQRDRPIGIVRGDLDAVRAWCRAENEWKAGDRSPFAVSPPHYRPMVPLDSAELDAALARGVPLLNV